MAKPTSKTAKPAATRGGRYFAIGDEGKVWTVRESSTGKFAGASSRVHTVLRAAEAAGLMQEKTDRIGGRVSPRLVAEAKKRTGIQADSDLIAFALANVALEDNFAHAFKSARGKVAPELELGF